MVDVLHPFPCICRYFVPKNLMKRKDEYRNTQQVQLEP
jgi:hypothetical protein